MFRWFLLTIVPIGIFTLFVQSLLPSGAPPYESTNPPPPESTSQLNWLNTWQRPPGPPKVGLQIGHLQTDQAPDELHRLRTNTGASGGGKSESEVNQSIANLTANILKNYGVEVDLLPVTIPPNYWADAFVAIHADGNLNPSVSGFKTATPWRDLTGRANILLDSINSAYAKSTSLSWDPNITRNMRGYYAFAWWRYEHSIHPMTPAVILETGFLTSPTDRRIIVDQPHLSAEGLATGIREFLINQKLLSQ